MSWKTVGDDELKKKERDFENLTRLKSGQQKDFNSYESDSTAINQRKKIADILNKLSVPNNEYNPQDTYEEFKNITRRERILYFDITNRIYNADDKNVGTILSNTEKLVEYASQYQETNEDSRCYRMICKFWDHCNLAYYQKNLNKNTQNSLNEKFQEYVNPYIEDIKKTEKEMQTQYISILGIFAAIVLAFTGGMTFSASILNNIHHASLCKLIIIACIIGLIFIFMIWLLMDFVRSIHGQAKRKYGVIIALSSVLIIIAGIAFCFYDKNDNIDNTEIPTVQEESDISYTD